ncbi:ribosome small subunit-dependent GTPase A [Streptomyces sp. 3MP-14]|uniref:Small ribosomal subunit biogenesis GTPase RsgA n=1 Tax=Streptomyces mimosae TaxID=2586635 RepID=A0A5N6AKD7_9ACTN|nr:MULTISPECIES: ribosome small subunit-dependent GTPase A [Streptomyces]KAB8168582.1 ribosome small subunit-dependent GTPase A [Streptomyces mimosae]KAB8178137.1 ribosome small subunit-dependent GTPase A [Streptomyces sp. 3MP-14]
MSSRSFSRSTDDFNDFNTLHESGEANDAAGPDGPVDPLDPNGLLAAHGWDDGWAAAFDGHDGLVPARVVRVDRGRCDLVTAAGPTRAESTAVPGACTGDWAALRDGAQPRLEALLPRRTAIVRATVSRDSHSQVLAANVDTVVLAVPAGGSLDAGRLERLLALAWESGARPVVALTKIDRAADPDAVLDEAAALAPGADVLATSALNGEGLDALAALLSGTVVLLGTSGAGKSTLGNALLGEEALATGDIRAVDDKGRHTTVRRELLPLPQGGVLIDTPGLRGVGLFEASDGLGQVFADIEGLAEECRFADCAHQAEPGCAVLAAIESGALPERRLTSYRKLLRENAWAAARTDARLRAEEANRRKSITRTQRAAYRFRDRQR